MTLPKVDRKTSFTPKELMKISQQLTNAGVVPVDDIKIKFNIITNHYEIAFRKGEDTDYFMINTRKVIDIIKCKKQLMSLFQKGQEHDLNS